MRVFKIVFDGSIAPKRRLIEVKYALSQIYHVDVLGIEPLFNGELHVLKENLTEIEADHYVEALESTGIVVNKVDLTAFAELMKHKSVGIKPKPIIQKPIMDAIQKPLVPLQPMWSAKEFDQDNDYSDYESTKFSFFNPSGRIGRMYFFNCFIGLSFLLITTKSLLNLPEIVFQLIQVVFGSIFVVQRLHDLNKSAWWFLFLAMACFGVVIGMNKHLWVLTSLLPIFIFIFVLYLFCVSGTQGENSYGAPPENSLTVIIIFWICMIATFLDVF